MKKFIWENCSDMTEHAFRVDDKGQHERVSICGKVYHPEIIPIKNHRQMALPIHCPACEKIEWLESKQEEAQSVK